MRIVFPLILIVLTSISTMFGVKWGQYLEAIEMSPPPPPVPRVLVLRSGSRVEIWLRARGADLRVQ